MGEDGWEFYAPSFSGLMQRSADLSYGSLNPDPFHEDQQGNVRDNTGQIVHYRSDDREFQYKQFYLNWELNVSVYDKDNGQLLYSWDRYTPTVSNKPTSLIYKSASGQVRNQNLG